MSQIVSNLGVHRFSLLLLLLGVSARPVYGDEWRLVEAAAPLAGIEAVEHTAWQSPRPPGGELDQIRLHRYRGEAAPQASFFYLPGTNMNGEAAVQDERSNLWLFLARRGVEVFTLDYRTHFVPPADLADASPFAAWDTATFVGDVRAAASEARRLAEGRPLFVGGFSRGVAFAYALAAAEPGGLRGLVALDGYFKHHAPQNGPDLAAASQALAAAGNWASDVGGRLGWAARQQLMTAVLAEAERGEAGPATRQLAEVLYRAWGPGGLANPAEGPGAGPTRSAVLARLLAGYDRYYPRLQDLEGVAFANQPDDPRTPIDDGWPGLSLPVLFVGSTGMGAQFLLHGLASAAHAGGKDLEIHVLEGHGHLDVLVGERAAAEVFAPVLAFITRLSAAPSSPEKP